jgi:hypothetical protein
VKKVVEVPVEGLLRLMRTLEYKRDELREARRINMPQMPALLARCSDMRFAVAKLIAPAWEDED